MVLDSSAVIAILKAEPEAATFLTKIAGTQICRLSAANLVEIGLVSRQDSSGAYRKALNVLLQDFSVRIEPVSERQAWIAMEAYDRFGKGTGHPAGLNFGDCFSYALARDVEEPLLYKGNDFSHTDLTPA
jgi:ribonuclease VapC